MAQENMWGFSQTPKHGITAIDSEASTPHNPSVMANTKIHDNTPISLILLSFQISSSVKQVTIIGSILRTARLQNQSVPTNKIIIQNMIDIIILR